MRRIRPNGVHAEGGANLQNGSADGFVGRTRTSVEECPATEVGRRQRTHRRRARHVPVLCPGDDVHKGLHLLKSGELLRHDRCLVLRVDVGGVSRMKARQVLPTQDRLLQLLRNAAAGDHILDARPSARCNFILPDSRWARPPPGPIFSSVRRLRWSSRRPAPMSNFHLKRSAASARESSSTLLELPACAARLPRDCHVREMAGPSETAGRQRLPPRLVVGRSLAKPRARWRCASDGQRHGGQRTARIRETSAPVLLTTALTATAVTEPWCCGAFGPARRTIVPSCPNAAQGPKARG
jgi:hypothetical protein